LSELIARLSQETSPSDIARGLVDSIVGFSPLLAREAVHRFSSGGNDLGAVVLALIDEVHSPETGAYLYSQASGLPALVSGARLTHLEGEYPGKRLQDLVSAMAILGESLLPRASFLEKKSVLEKKVRQEAKRTGKDLKMAKADLKEGEREHEYRLAGEMILSHLQSVRKGDAQVTLPNLYGKPGETVTVDLDPVLPPNENADRFFKKAKKAARKKTDGALRVKDLETKAEECSAKLARIETATSEDDLEKIEPGVEGPERQKGPRKKDKIDPIRKLARIYHSRDGCAIWVGRGPRESDELRRRFSRGSDLWIHTRDLPGPHVIIHSDSKIAEFPQETILDAAHLAAHHGKARGEKSVPVYMTEVKNLRSPKHAPPGKVTVANDRGFEVRIDPERMKRLLEGNTPR
jgi:predicted ribosome quality control (RQC) complex YloA/Tae2 family protein